MCFCPSKQKENKKLIKTVNNKSYLIKKRNSFTHKKRFSEKILLSDWHGGSNLLLSKALNRPHSLDPSNSLNIKACLYALLKEYKRYKRESLDVNTDFALKNLNDFALKLQSSGFYLSVVEFQKLKSLRQLQLKVIEFYLDSLLGQSKKSECFRSFNSGESVAFDEFSIEKAYHLFNRRPKSFKFALKSEAIQKKKEEHNLKSFSILQKKYNRFIESRLFLFFDSHKKSYKKVLLQSRKIRVYLRKLFAYDNKIDAAYVKKKKFYYKKYKSLVWQRKKRKNRKKTGLLRFLRRRRRLLFQFYVPRHLEINYKTFEIIHLGFFDLSTTNSRIPYWLNLRRLLTFLSL